MSRLYVVGGQQQHARSMLEQEERWYKFRKGLILEVDPSTSAVQQRVEYVSPPDARPDDEDAAILFKSSTFRNGRLYACTQTEVLIYRVPEFQLESSLSLPCFNDVHHVSPTPEGTLIIAISGLDMVVEISMDGEVLREWNTLGQDPWERFRKQTDYRHVLSTKPHQSHPNHIFFIDGDVWVTRFQQCDAICLSDPSKSIPIGRGLVHDGYVEGDHVYFTTVNGQIVVANARTRVVEEVIDLNDIAPSDGMLGWCRGILLQDGKIWVGFSRLRLTKFRENISWVRWGFKKQLPSRIACYDLTRRACIQQIDVQEHGLDAVFSIHPAAHGGDQR